MQPAGHHRLVQHGGAFGRRTSTVTGDVVNRCTAFAQRVTKQLATAVAAEDQYLTTRQCGGRQFRQCQQRLGVGATMRHDDPRYAARPQRLRRLLADGGRREIRRPRAQRQHHVQRMRHGIRADEDGQRECVEPAGGVGHRPRVVQRLDIDQRQQQRLAAGCADRLAQRSRLGARAGDQHTASGQRAARPGHRVSRASRMSCAPSARSSATHSAASSSGWAMLPRTSAAAMRVPSGRATRARSHSAPPSTTQ